MFFHKHNFIITGYKQLGIINVNGINYTKVKTFYKCKTCSKQKEVTDYHSPKIIIDDIKDEE